MIDVQEKKEFLNQAFEHNFNHITLADSKAAIFVTIQSLLITIGIASLLVSDTLVKLKENTHPCLATLYILSLLFYIGTSLTGIFVAINIFRPRGPSGDGQNERTGFLYFGHISNYQSSAEYHKAVIDVDEDTILEELCDQTYQIAKIADKKMKYVKKSIKFLYINVAFTIAMLFYTVFIHLSG